MHIHRRKTLDTYYMNDPKLENIFNLALDSTEEERNKSLELNVGYEQSTKTWDIIVKYSGDLKKLESEFPQIQVVEMQNEYAIMTVPQDFIKYLVQLPQIEYIEKPKRLFFDVMQGKTASCINIVQTQPYNLSGRGVLIGIIDSGIDYSHPDFRNADGTTRILNLWDQTLIPTTPSQLPPKGYRIGVAFSEAQINEALEQPSQATQYELVPSRDLSGHGTHVAGIAAGNGNASNGTYRGVAYESSLIVVKLGTPKSNGFPRTAELMQALDYVVKKALEYLRPIAINISFGNTYGSHSGTSLLETFLNDLANLWKNSIIIGTGNEGFQAGHTSGQLQEKKEEKIQLAVSPFEKTLNLQIWKSYVDEFEISIRSPGGQIIRSLRQNAKPQRSILENTELLIYYGQPSPYSLYQEIYIDFLPTEEYINSGIWEILLTPKKIVQGDYHMWLPSQVVLNLGTGFLFPTENTTLTIPSTSAKGIAVGAYDSRYDSFADFSGRGYTRETNQVKPDLVAPGVAIVSAAVGGGYTAKTGTSMAAPFVTGSAALLMQYGIIDGRDPFIYGEKLKAYLIKGARQLPGFTKTPNPLTGWGALCLGGSLP